MTEINLETMTVGGGCFWCMEAVFNEIKGVRQVTSGYMGGTVPGTPTYREVCSGLTGHAEVVQVQFDPTIVSYEDLLVVFMTSHDPTSLNKQGGDVGTQYRSVIFYNDLEQKSIAEFVVEEIAPYFETLIVTEISPVEKFHKAVEEHQNYYSRNKSERYCSAVITPKLAKLRTMHADKLKYRNTNNYTEAMEVQHDKEKQQFTMEVDGEIAKIDYKMRDGIMHLVYSEVPFNIRGQGIGKVLVEKTFEKLTDEGYKAIAVCGYIKSVASKSKKWNAIIG